MQGRGKTKKNEFRKIVLTMKDLQTSACLNYGKKLKGKLFLFPTLWDNIGHWSSLM